MKKIENDRQGFCWQRSRDIIQCELAGYREKLIIKINWKGKSL